MIYTQKVQFYTYVLATTANLYSDLFTLSSELLVEYTPEEGYGLGRLDCTLSTEAINK